MGKLPPFHDDDDDILRRTWRVAIGRTGSRGNARDYETAIFAGKQRVSVRSLDGDLDTR